jgi:hypothetical protein
MNLRILDEPGEKRVGTNAVGSYRDYQQCGADLYNIFAPSRPLGGHHDSDQQQLVLIEFNASLFSSLSLVCSMRLLGSLSLARPSRSPKHRPQRPLSPPLTLAVALLTSPSFIFDNFPLSQPLSHLQYGVCRSRWVGRSPLYSLSSKTTVTKVSEQVSEEKTSMAPSHSTCVWIGSRMLRRERT